MPSFPSLTIKNIILGDIEDLMYSLIKRYKPDEARCQTYRKCLVTKHMEPLAVEIMTIS